MVDTIIKGTGNSRTIKTVPNIKSMVGSLDDLLDLLIAGFPVDIGPLNAAGLQTQGTDLNKANLLTDATAKGMGLTGAATPNTAFAKLRELIATAQNAADGKCKIASGTYIGTGLNGAGQKNLLSFLFQPKVVLVIDDYIRIGVFVYNGFGNCVSPGDNSSGRGHVLYTEFGENYLSWYSTYDQNSQLNRYNATYYYTAIG